MSVLVFIVGLLMATLGIIVFVSPTQLKRFLEAFASSNWWRYLTVARVIIGIIFLFAATDSEWPWFMVMLGVLFIASGIALPLIGPARSKMVADWWMQRSDPTLRLWGGIALILGLAVIWAI